MRGLFKDLARSRVRRNQGCGPRGPFQPDQGQGGIRGVVCGVYSRTRADQGHGGIRGVVCRVYSRTLADQWHGVAGVWSAGFIQGLGQIKGTEESEAWPTGSIQRLWQIKGTEESGCGLQGLFKDSGRSRA